MGRSKPSVVSLFAGAGGLDVGLERAAFETIFASDLDPFACETLRQNAALAKIENDGFDDWAKAVVRAQRCHTNLSDVEFVTFLARIAATLGKREIDGPRVVSQVDVRELSARKILEMTGKCVGEIDLIAGGPPCQPFSRAGKREMFKASDGLLFLEFVRLVEELRPKFFLFENVKGIAIQKSDIVEGCCSTCEFTEILPISQLSALREGQRTECCPRCKQGDLLVRFSNRVGAALAVVENEFRRIGYTLHTKVLNAADFGAPQSRERVIIVGSRDGSSFQFPQETHIDPRRLASQNDLFLDGRSPWRTMADTIFAQPHSRFGRLDLDVARLWVKNVVRPHAEPVTWHLERIAPTVGAHQSAKLAIAPRGVPEKQLARQQWHTKGHRQGDSPPVPVEHAYLSDEELLELQTFPKDWYLHGTRMNRAFQIGNAVPPILAQALGEAILKCLQLSLPEKRVAYG